MAQKNNRFERFQHCKPPALLEVDDLGGILKAGVRLSKEAITFMFEMPEPELVEMGDVLGIDIGKVTAISCSNGHVSRKNKHGHDLNSIIEVMSRKKKGGKGFKRCEEHRKNYINWAINQLKLGGIKQINIERIQYLRKGKKSSRQMSHWTYTQILGKLMSKAQEQGVLVRELNPVYTSQRCSICGWVRKGNRNGKMFRCDQCGHHADADLNASQNLALPLLAINKKQRLAHENRKGFYWDVPGQEPIVPATH